MKTGTALKLGQVAGVLILCAWVAAYVVTKSPNSALFILGIIVYGGCRLALWLRKSE